MLPLTELGHRRQGQQNEMGGVKWASSPHVGMEGQRSNTSMWNAPTYREVPTPILDGFIPFKAAKQKQQSTRSCSLKEKGGCTYRPLRNTPHLTIYTDSCYTYFKLIVTVVHTRKLLYE